MNSISRVAVATPVVAMPEDQSTQARKAGKSQQEFLIFKMDDLIVSSYNISDSSSNTGV